jgi:N-acetylglutamate synthase-like GNAT family acetyltransferase
LRLGLTKLMCVDPAGGVRGPDGGRRSFVDLDELRRLRRDGTVPESAARRRLLAEIEVALEEGVAAVNLSTLEGLADELFTYAGSGTLFTRQRYVHVRRLGLDDFDAANHLVERGVAEGYLAPRPLEEVERVLASGFGAFVEGRHLAGIGALLEHPGAGAAEISCLYTLTRFVAEGVGSHLVRFALDRARERGFASVFACTTSDRVVGFFARNGFDRVEPEALPPEKWWGYDPERRARVACLRLTLR